MNDNNKLAGALKWAISVNPDDIRAYVAKKREAHADTSNRDLADSIVATYATRAGAVGFATGLGTNPFVMFGSALGDMAIILRMYSFLTAAVGYLSDPKYFEDPDWEDDALLMMAGPKAISRAMQVAGVELGKQTTKRAIKTYLSKGVLQAVKRLVLKWFGKKVTQKMILTKAIPVVGGIVGGAWNYAELRIVGRRIVAYHFDEDGGFATE